MLSRRAFVTGVLATASSGAVAACRSGGRSAGSTSTTAAAPTTLPAYPADLAAVAIATDPFILGVASGDPDASSVVLWTRLAPDPFTAGAGLPAEATEVWVEVDGVTAGRFPVDVERGHSVHAVVDGLEPSATYTYRFRIGGWTSPDGTTRTTPAADDDATPLRVAVASCQRYDHGAFAAHRSIAAADVDLVAFVGDYVYEAPTAGDATRPLPGPRGGDTAADLTTYRDRYVAARLDPDLAAAHAAHPWVLTWDDHEVANDADPGEVDPARRAAAYQAWWEHQPVRLPPPPADGAEPYPIERTLRWGTTAELLALDTRQFRSPVACGGGLVRVGSCDELADPARTMLGADQEAWVGEQLAAPAPPAWTLLANSVVLADVEILGLVNADAWDGYPAARAALVEQFRPGTIVLTGDIHVAVVADVRDATGEVRATELVTPSISSRVADRYADAVPFLPLVAPDVRHAADHRGWLRVDLDPTAGEATATYLRVEDPADPASAVTEDERFTI